MNYRILSLKAVYDAIKRIHGNPKNPPPIPRRGTSAYQEYSSAAKALIKNVSGSKGVYLWFAKDSRPGKEYIYVGESHKNRDGIRGRLSDEFKQWYHIFWMTAFQSTKYEGEVIRMYNTPKVDYTTDVKNQSTKAGSTHIVLASTDIHDFDALSVQNDLIQLFGNPRGNAKDVRSVPVPNQQIMPISREIFEEFQNFIDKSEAYQL